MADDMDEIPCALCGCAESEHGGEDDKGDAYCTGCGENCEYEPAEEEEE